MKKNSKGPNGKKKRHQGKRSKKKASPETLSVVTGGQKNTTQPTEGSTEGHFRGDKEGAGGGTNRGGEGKKGAEKNRVKHLMDGKDKKDRSPTIATKRARTPLGIPNGKTGKERAEQTPKRKVREKTVRVAVFLGDQQTRKQGLRREKQSCEIKLLKNR